MNWYACSRRHSILASGVFILFIGRSAHADPTPTERETARLLLREGLSLEEAGRLQEARDKFAVAYAIARTPITGYTFARVRERLGEWVEARDLALEVVRMQPIEGETERSAIARKGARELAMMLEPKIPSLVVSLVLSKALPSVLIDGRPVQRSVLGQPMTANPGKHRLIVQCNARTVYTSDVSLVPAQRMVIAVPTELSGCDEPPRRDMPRSPDGLVPKGFVFGGGVMAGLYYVPVPDMRFGARVSGSGGFYADVGYAISPRLELLFHGFFTIGPQGDPSYLGSAGARLLFGLTRDIWIGFSMLGGRAQTATGGYTYTSDFVFSPTIDLDFELARQDYGHWFMGVHPCVYIGDTIKGDYSFAYVPLTIGVRTF